MSYQIDRPPHQHMADIGPYNDLTTGPVKGRAAGMPVCHQNHSTATDDPEMIGQASGNAPCPIEAGEKNGQYGEEIPGDTTRTHPVRMAASGDHIRRRTGCGNPPAKIRWLNMTVRRDSGGTKQ